VPERDGLIQRHSAASASIRRIYRSQQRAGGIGIKNFQLIHFNRMELQLLNRFNA